MKDKKDLAEDGMFAVVVLLVVCPLMLAILLYILAACSVAW